MTSTAVHGQK